MINFAAIRAVLLDLDGVIYRGINLCRGTAEFIGLIQTLGVKPFFLSNNSRSGPEAVASKLTSLGIPARTHDVITAAEMIVEWMDRRPRKGTVAIIGSEWLGSQLAQRGWMVVDQQPDYLVVGLDHDLNYRKLRMGVTALLHGASFVAANRDRVNPIEDTLEPGCGAIVAALEVASGRRARCIGKPAVAMFRKALKRLDLAPSQVIMVGDSLDSDMPMARRGGAHSVLVLSGQTTRAQVDRLPAARRPELVVEDLAALHACWSRHTKPAEPARLHFLPVTTE